MPFVKPVIERVLPYVDEAIITISKKSTDRTYEQVEQLMSKYPDKIQVDTESVGHPSELTIIRQMQLAKSKSTWILFLDDDDWWPIESLERIIELLKKDEDVDGYSFTPYQIINEQQHDSSWRRFSFSKIFRREGAHYRHPWPKDLIYRHDRLVYWKKNPKCVKVDIPFFHLSYIKDSSFRTEGWAKKYAHHIGRPELIPEKYAKDIQEIWKILKG